MIPITLVLYSVITFININPLVNNNCWLVFILINVRTLYRTNIMGIVGQINLDLLCHLLQDVHRACYVKLSGATVI